MSLILASTSPTRRRMLADAGVPHEAMSPQVDEESAKAALGHLTARDLADALAELKATKLSTRHPQALVLGCDSTVETADGRQLDKAPDRASLRDQLAGLRGTTHKLWSAAVLCRGGRPVWRQVDGARLAMRDFSDAFLDAYLDAEWPAVGGCVGGYRLEGRGAQLFARIDGSHFTILGLPLLPLLEQLRALKEMPA
ncbi:Maf family protein [Sphingomonas quercus]|uniref:Nucleoside triphosphate pyrophosphatase n=1 Tax=Sphingomonas quercus TaxID=2842451 RepID=A0ABS6BFG3_9SPHN|nr:nucleoside triphosphate pyrophosphatase [Sphingomonas quercus]MBU3076924.1 Maf family protein [Sphingomonas quercus]